MDQWPVVLCAQLPITAFSLCNSPTSSVCSTTVCFWSYICHLWVRNHDDILWTSANVMGYYTVTCEHNKYSYSNIIFPERNHAWVNVAATGQQHKSISTRGLLHPVTSSLMDVKTCLKATAQQALWQYIKKFNPVYVCQPIANSYMWHGRSLIKYIHLYGLKLWVVAYMKLINVL